MSLNRCGASADLHDLAAGRITGYKKIAATAEANYVDVVSHDPLGPVSTAACIQIVTSIPNFALYEYHTAPNMTRRRESS